jgi:phosphoglucosamine mutase
MSNLGMRHALASLGIQFIEAKVGDRFVMEQMKCHGATLGGEGSGHIICLDKSTSGDGIISALQVLDIVCKSDKVLHDLKNEMIKYPQVLINVKTADKIDLESHVELNKTLKAVESALGDEGRVLIRASGTEPLIRVMVEASDLSVAENSAKKLAAAL